MFSAEKYGSPVMNIAFSFVQSDDSGSMQCEKHLGQCGPRWEVVDTISEKKKLIANELMAVINAIIANKQ